MHDLNLDEVKQMEGGISQANGRALVKTERIMKEPLRELQTARYGRD